MRHARDTRKTARTNTLHGVSRNTNGRSQGSQTQSRERNNTWPTARGRSMSGLQTLLKRQCCGLLRLGDLVCLHMSPWIEESIETRLDPPRAAHCLPIPPHLSPLHTALPVSATHLESSACLHPLPGPSGPGFAGKFDGGKHPSVRGGKLGAKRAAHSPEAVGQSPWAQKSSRGYSTTVCRCCCRACSTLPPLWCIFEILDHIRVSGCSQPMLRPIIYQLTKGGISLKVVFRHRLY